MNLPDNRTEKSQPSRASKTALLLMAAMVICLTVLAIFANAQRFRRDAIEVVKIQSTSSPTPQER